MIPYKSANMGHQKTTTPPLKTCALSQFNPTCSKTSKKWKHTSNSRSHRSPNFDLMVSKFFSAFIFEPLPQTHTWRHFSPKFNSSTNARFNIHQTKHLLIQPSMWLKMHHLYTSKLTNYCSTSHLKKKKTNEAQILKESICHNFYWRYHCNLTRGMLAKCSDSISKDGL